MAWVPAMRDIDLALIDPPYTFDAWDALLVDLHAEYALCEAGSRGAAARGLVDGACPPLRTDVGDGPRPDPDARDRLSSRAR